MSKQIESQSYYECDMCNRKVKSTTIPESWVHIRLTELSCYGFSWPSLRVGASPMYRSYDVAQTVDLCDECLERGISLGEFADWFMQRNAHHAEHVKGDFGENFC